MAKLQDRHIEYLKNPDFYNIYLNILNNRLIYSNNSIENDNMKIETFYDYASVLSLKDNYDAFQILLRKLDDKSNNPLTQELIIKLANTINKHSEYISDGYRKIGKNHKLDDKFPISDPEDIEKDMEKLLENYYGKWSSLDIFEREALFNIEFLRIHPFEDGNGRTSRLILNFNMLRQLHAPIIIPEHMRSEYFYARDYNDVNWIKNMFEDRSKKELIAIDELIKSFEFDDKNDNPFQM